MATRQEFCNKLLEYYLAHSAYIGGANGQTLFDLGIKGIVNCENGYEGRNHANDLYRDFSFIAKLCKEGCDLSKSRGGDCSGINVGAMRELGIIPTTADYRACEFQAAGTAVPLDDLQPADFVFDKKKNAAHMGTYIGDGYVIESKGRDVGVVKRKLSEGSWVIGGRLDWFDGDVPALKRNLKYIPDNLMKGEDVKQCQKRLKLKDCDCGEIDGVFGKKTQSAVSLFQLNHGLEVDGVVGQKTWAKLWE